MTKLGPIKLVRVLPKQVLEYGRLIYDGDTEFVLSNDDQQVTIKLLSIGLLAQLGLNEDGTLTLNFRLSTVDYEAVGLIGTNFGRWEASLSEYTDGGVTYIDSVVEG